jgi:membrane-anchored glycerophosphoryl diester phosphodiesterase (GDPDase)
VRPYWLICLLPLLATPDSLGQKIIFAGAMTIYSIFLISVFWLLIATLTTLGINQANEIPLRIRSAFRESWQVKSKLLGLFFFYFFFMFVVYGVLIAAGASILIIMQSTNPLLTTALTIPTFFILLYLMLPFRLFALPLIIKKKCSVFQSYKMGLRAMNQHWFRILASELILVLLLLISAIPFGIGLIWTIPMIWAANGLWYKEIFGSETTQ